MIQWLAHLFGKNADAKRREAPETDDSDLFRRLMYRLLADQTNGQRAYHSISHLTNFRDLGLSKEAALAHLEAHIYWPVPKSKLASVHTVGDLVDLVLAAKRQSDSNDLRLIAQAQMIALACLVVVAAGIVGFVWSRVDQYRTTGNLGRVASDLVWPMLIGALYTLVRRRMTQSKPPPTDT